MKNVGDGVPVSRLGGAMKLAQSACLLLHVPPTPY